MQYQPVNLALRSPIYPTTYKNVSLPINIINSYSTPQNELVTRLDNRQRLQYTAPNRLERQPQGINITTDIMNKIIESKVAEANSQEGVQRRINAKKDQDEREERYIKSTQVCPVSKLSNIRDHISTIDPRKFEELIHDKFYDPAVMKEAMCVTNSLFYPDPRGSVENNERLREWIEDLKQIGDKSIEGYAMSADMNNSSSKVMANNLFVIKTPQKPSNDNLLHELFIGFQLNELKKYVPNFVYTFGGLKCTSPVIDTNKEVVSWCLRSKNSVNFVLYENIQPSVSMMDYVKTASLSSFLDKYLQVMFAVLLANKLKKYSHGDLHPGNVLIRDIDSDKFSIPYLTEDGEVEYLITDKLSVIIDPGFNYMKVDGQDYGYFDAGPYGAQYDADFLIYDAYKLMMWSAYIMMVSGNINYVKLEPMFRFFNKTENFESALKKQVNTSYAMVYIPETSNLKLVNFLRYMRVNYPEMKQILVPDRPHNLRTLGCDGTDICISSKSEVINVIGLNKPLEVKSIIHFYDLVSRLEQENRINDIDDVFSRFDIQKGLEDGYNRYNTLLTKILKYKQTTVPVRIKGLRIRGLLLNTDLYKKHEEYVIRTMEIWDLLHTILFTIDAIRYLYRWIDVNNTDNQNAINMLETHINTILTPVIHSFNQTLSIFVDQHNYLTDIYIKNAAAINQAIKNDNDVAIWYWNTYDNYYNIITTS